MTDTNISDTNNAPAYSSEAEGLRQAATDHRALQDTPAEELHPQPVPTTAEIEGREDDGEGVSAHRAAKALSRYRQTMAENRAALDQAMGLGEPETANTGATEPPVQQDSAQDPAQQMRQQAEAERIQAAAQAEWERAHQARAGHIQALQIAESIITAEFLRDFPDVKSLNDLQALAHTNPERYVQAHAALNRAQAVVSEHQQVGQQAAQDAQAQYQHWAHQQDDVFTGRHPELKDPKIAQQMGDLALQELQKIGLSRQEITALYHGVQDISFRDARTQEILLDAIRWRASKNRMKEIASKPLPAVQRPGTRRDAMPGEHAAVQAAEKAMSTNPSLRNATRLMQARRAAGMR
jgi:hypothetical protein